VSRPFDSSMKYLLETFPGDWPAYLGTAGGWPVRVVNADLSTVTSEADKVLVVDAPEPWLLHVEVQAGHDAAIPARLLRYNVLLDARHGLPAQSVVVLLRPEADSPGFTGVFQRRVPGEAVHHEFRYKVVRAWRQPVRAILEGGIGTLPLAPISDVAPGALPGVIRRMEERLEREAPPEVIGDLWTTTLLLMGLRYDQEETGRLLRGVRAMKESVTYQAILEEGEARGEARGRAEGRTEGKREDLFRLGRKRFGPPSTEIAAAIEALTDPQQIEAIIDRIFDAASWQELLDKP